jgi:hypothetical protein
MVSGEKLGFISFNPTCRAVKHKTNGKYFYQYPGLGNIVGLAIK